VNDVLLLREAGPEAAPLSPAARSAARAALMTEIARGPWRAPHRLWRPSRAARRRIGVGIAVLAAAYTGAVIVAAPDQPSAPPDSVTLVHFTTPTFPLSLDPAPAGLRPAFDGTGNGSLIADYRDASADHGFTLSVHHDEPDRSEEGAPGYRSEGSDVVTVAGRRAELSRYSRQWCTGDSALDCPRRSFAVLTWKRHADQWVVIRGDGRYDSPAQLLGVAASLVDRPQPATLSVGLAPAGWSVQGFKMGRVLTLVDHDHEQQTMSIHLPLPAEVLPADKVATSIEAPKGPMRPVTVNGRPAQLVPTANGWFLQAQFPDGRTFVVQAPASFTEADMLAVAEQVRHNP
jgi:hypothetical protein